MVLSEAVRRKILLMEEAINFPASVLSHGNHRWKNLPMVPYSNLLGAVLTLAEKGRKVAIVTGFYFSDSDPPATETDGPPGALILAEGLKHMGMKVILISDPYTVPALRAGLKFSGMTGREIPILSFPMEHSDENYASRRDNQKESHTLSLRFVEDFFNGPMGKDLTHLIYIERVGPNHTLESFLSQNHSNPDLLKEFERILPPPVRNRCYNSRLEDVTRLTGRTHLFLDALKGMELPIETIGIGDRGNEIGAGAVPWKIFKDLSEDHQEAIFCCRIETDYLIACGISNWGGYALLTGVALARGKLDFLEKVTAEQERKALDYLIHHGPAVDGITRRQVPSVDGIQFDAYMKVIERLKEIVIE